MRAKEHRERSVTITMSDPLEETISLSDMTEITETEDPRATQYSCRVAAYEMRDCPLTSVVLLCFIKRR